MIEFCLEILINSSRSLTVSFQPVVVHLVTARLHLDRQLINSVASSGQFLTSWSKLGLEVDCRSQNGRQQPLPERLHILLQPRMLDERYFSGEENLLSQLIRKKNRPRRQDSRVFSFTSPACNRCSSKGIQLRKVVTLEMAIYPHGAASRDALLRALAISQSNTLLKKLRTSRSSFLLVDHGSDRT